MIYQSLIVSVSRVREYGANKHGSGEEGWRTTEIMDHLDAARRHIDETIEAIRNNDPSRLFDIDENGDGSHELHLANAVCNLMFEIERYCTNERNSK